MNFQFNQSKTKKELKAQNISYQLGFGWCLPFMGRSSGVKYKLYLCAHGFAADGQS
jgi:hypothetical protein